MKLLTGYTLDYIRRNRRNSLAIMVAVLMASTMLSALCGFLYTTYTDNLSYVLRETGNWHGELYDDTLGSMLPTVESFDSVEAVMIKGAWRTAKIDDPRRDYLVWRDAGAAYWESMPEGDSAILEGRAPVRAGEIALSKQYFENHQALALGDTLTLTEGLRVGADAKPMEQQDIARPGESFQETGVVELKVVGKLDVATSSTVPAYTALGFLDPAAVRPEDKLTVYLRFHRIRDTYKELPKIAAALGYEPDEYGRYSLRYNTDYLARKAVLSPEQTGLVPVLMASQMPLMFAVMGLLTVGLFVLIIHNAFALSSSARLSFLGIFASVGASPRQIRRSVVTEAFLLTVIPLPVGLLLGQLAVAWLMDMRNRMITYGDQIPVIFSIGWQSVLPAIVLTLLTVWWSALIPAKRVARMSPIEAIRQGGAEKLKKPRRFSVSRLGALWGIYGELAANALQARRRSYRTATVSLTLSFLILAGFLCINSASEASMRVYRTEEKQWEEQDILLTLYNVATPEDYAAATEAVGELEGMKRALWYNTLRAATWLPEEDFSDEFKEKGGFAAVEKKLSGPQVPLLREGKRRVDMTLLGLDPASFQAYCDSLGIDAAPFYEEDSCRGILYHTVYDVTTGTKRNPCRIPLFDLKAGDSVTLTEKTTDSQKGDFTFETQIAAIAGERPPVGSAAFGKRYSAILTLPMSRVHELGTHFAENRAVRVDGVLEVTDPERITPVRNRIEQICESHFGSGDYRLVDQKEYEENSAAGTTVMALMLGFVTGLLGVIGLANVWTTVRGTLNARRREFAMLRSVGLPPGGLRRMLALEAALLGVTPVLLSLPVILVLQGVFLFINEVTFLEWLPCAPWQPVLLYVAAVLGVTVAAYAAGGRKLLTENIIEEVKVDAV